MAENNNDGMNKVLRNARGNRTVIVRTESKTDAQMNDWIRAEVHGGEETEPVEQTEESAAEASERMNAMIRGKASRRYQHSSGKKGA